MANRFFVGAVDSDWHDTGNWDTVSGGPGGASVPTVGDNAIFDVNSPSCTVDADIDCDALLSSVTGFAGTLDLNGFDWTGGSINWTTGTLKLGSGTVTLSGTITVTGGTLNMESAAVDAASFCNASGTAVITLSSGTFKVGGNLSLNPATFNHNNGLVEFDGNSNFNPYGNTYWNLKLSGSGGVTVTGTLTANDLEVTGGTWNANGYAHTLGGNLTVSAGTVTMGAADWSVAGDLAFSGTAAVTLTSGVLDVGGQADFSATTLTHNNGRVRFNGTGVTTFTTAGKSFHRVEQNDATAALTVQTVGNLSCYQLDLIAGSLWDTGASNCTIGAGGLSIATDINFNDGAHTVSGPVSQTAGTASGGDSTLTFSGTVNIGGGGSGFFATTGVLDCTNNNNAVTIGAGYVDGGSGTFKVGPSFSGTKALTWGGVYFGNVELVSRGQSTINITGTAGAMGNLTLGAVGGSCSARIMGGRIQVQGDVTMTALCILAFRSSFVVEFVDSNAQNWTDLGTPGTGRWHPGVEFNKSGDQVTLGSPMTVVNQLVMTTDSLVTNGYKLLLSAAAGAGDTFNWTPGGITYDDIETRMWPQSRVNVTGTALVGGKLTIPAAISGTGDRQVNGGQIDVYGDYEAGWIADNANDAGTTLIRMAGAVNAQLIGTTGARTRYGNPLTIAKTGGAAVTQSGNFGLRSNNLNVDSPLATAGFDLGARDVTLGAGGTLSGGGILRVYRTLDLVTGGGTWAPGTGTVEIWAQSLAIPGQQITGSPAFNNLTVGQDAGASTSFTLTLTGSPVVAGTLDLRGYNSGGWQRFVNGNTLYARGAVLNTGSQPVFGTTLLVVDGTVTQQVAINGGLSLTVAKATGLCQFTGVMVINASYGNVTHTYDASCDWITNTCYWTVYTVGGNRTVQLAGTGISSIVVPGVSINHAAGANPAILNLGGLTIFSGDTQYTASYSTHSRRIDNGVIDVSGNLVVNIVDAGVYTGTALFRMTGSADKNLTFTAASQDRYWNDLEVAKTGGARVTLVNAMGTKGAGQDIAVTSGVFDLAGYSVTAGGTFSVTAASTLRAKGSETITAAVKTFNAASNTVLYDAAVTALLNGLSTAFGNLNVGPGGKTVQTTAGTTIAIGGDLSSSGSFASKTVIRSTVAGNQARWNLAGNSLLTNTVDVKDNDASGGKTIYALGSTDSGNNLNWVFGSGGGRHLRTAFTHGCPEGFTGGLSAGDFTGYTGGGMPGMGAAAAAAAPAPPAGPAMVVGGASPTRFSADGAVTWADTVFNPAIVFPYSVQALLAIGANKILAFLAKASSTLVYKSTDGGANFAQVGSLVRRMTGTWAPILLPTGRVIMGVQDEATGTDFLCAYSDDEGATWTVVTVLAGGDAATYAYDTAHIMRQADGKLITMVITALSATKTYYSTDNGATWILGAGGPTITNTLYIFRHPDGTYGSIRTPGGGSGLVNIRRHVEGPAGTWSNVDVTTFFYPPNVPVMSFLDGGDGLTGWLFAFGGDADSLKVLRTLDGGATWAQIQTVTGIAGANVAPAFNAPFLKGADRYVPYDDPAGAGSDVAVQKDSGAGFAKTGAKINAGVTVNPVGIVVN